MEQTSNIVLTEKTPSVYVEEIEDEVEDVTEMKIENSPIKDVEENEEKKVTFDNKIQA